MPFLVSAICQSFRATYPRMASAATKDRLRLITRDNRVELFLQLVIKAQYE
jgi:hypothetical protein